jgi:hypothetical protein
MSTPTPTHPFNRKIFEAVFNEKFPNPTGSYVSVTTYPYNKKDKKIGVATMSKTIHEDDPDHVTLTITHSGENGHFESFQSHFTEKNAIAIHTSNMTIASHHGSRLYVTKNKKIVSEGSGYSHISGCIVNFKRVFDKNEDGHVIIRTYINTQDDNFKNFKLQSTTKLIRNNE